LLIFVIIKMYIGLLMTSLFWHCLFKDRKLSCL